jgi:translation initiation factor 4E
MVRPRNVLENSWTLWFEQRPESEGNNSVIFGNRLNEICSMDSVEEFHQYYIYMKTPDALPIHSTLYVFKDKVRPMWESFPTGGFWTFRMKRDDARLYGSWERLMMSCIGEGIGSSNVAGIVLGSRPKEFVLSVWLISGESSQQRFEIMEQLRDILKLHEGDHIQYKDFHSAIQDDSTRVNAVTYRVRGPHHAKSSFHQGRKFILPDPVNGSFTFNF